MKFCSQCGSNQIQFSIPEGDNRPRHSCLACGHIFYQNPKVICGCIATHEDKVLLCKRAIEPRLGFWTLPAGFLENGETTEEGAMRETFEETMATVEIHHLYTVFNLPDINQIYLFFRANMLTPHATSTDESLEIGLFDQTEIPWSELAFSSVHQALTLFFKDQVTQTFPVHIKTIRKPDAH